jgi:hypothetical protein
MNINSFIFCESKQLKYSRIPGLAIKRSMKITRGKTDKIDATPHLSGDAAGRSDLLSNYVSYFFAQVPLKE